MKNKTKTAFPLKKNSAKCKKFRKNNLMCVRYNSHIARSFSLHKKIELVSIFFPLLLWKTNQVSRLFNICQVIKTKQKNQNKGCKGWN